MTSITGDDLEKYSRLKIGMNSQEDVLESEKIDQIDALKVVGDMLTDGGNLFFGACFSGRMHNNNGTSISNSTPQALGNVLLNKNNINIFLNNDATYFYTDKGLSTLNFDKPLTPSFSLREGFTIINKSSSGQIKVSTFKLQLQLNSKGKEPVVPIRPPLN